MRELGGVRVYLNVTFKNRYILILANFGLIKVRAKKTND